MGLFGRSGVGRRTKVATNTGTGTGGSRGGGGSSNSSIEGGGASSSDDAYAAGMDKAMKLMRSRDPDEMASEDDAARRLAHERVEQFVHGQRAGSDMEERKQSAMELAKVVNSAYGISASAIGVHLRQSQGLAFVLQLLYEGEVQLQRTGLMLLSNLVSDAFDPRSWETKVQVLHAGVFERIKDFIFAMDGVAQTYACACIQNLAKDFAFAKLLRSYELVEELERLVSVSPNEHLKKYAAGALFNCVEAISREARLRSLDSLEQAAVSAETEAMGGGAAKTRKGVMSMMFAEREDEIELSEDVLAELAKREELQRVEDRDREEAAAAIQAIVRQRRTTRAFKMLRRMAIAVRLVTQYVKSFRRRRRRKAALVVQKHARASIVHRLGICDYCVMLGLISSTRAAYARCLSRNVNRRMALYRLEQKRKEAARIVVQHEVRLGRRASTKLGRQQRREATGLSRLKRTNEGNRGSTSSRSSSTLVGGKGEIVDRKPRQGLVARAQASAQSVVKSMEQTTKAISSRIPLVPSRAPSSSVSPYAPPAGATVPKCGGSVVASGDDGDWCAGATPHTPSNGIMTSQQQQQQAMVITPQGSLFSPEGTVTPQQQQPSDPLLFELGVNSMPSQLGSSSAHQEHRRLSASASKTILNLSAPEGDDTEADGDCGASGWRPPVRRLFPPGAGASAALRFAATPSLQQRPEADGASGSESTRRASVNYATSGATQMGRGSQ